MSDNLKSIINKYYPENKKYSEEFREKLKEIKLYLNENKYPSSLILENLIKDLHAFGEEDFSINAKLLDTVYYDLIDQYLNNSPTKISWVTPDDEEKRTFFISPFIQKNGGIAVILPYKDSVDNAVFGIGSSYIREEKKDCFLEDAEIFKERAANQNLPGNLIDGMHYKGRNFFFSYKLYPLWPVSGLICSDLDHCGLKVGD